MNRTFSWTAILLGLIGVVVGYSLVIAMHGDTVFANARSCPSRGTCTGEDCQKHDCKNGNCKNNCPGCKKNA